MASQEMNTYIAVGAGVISIVGDAYLFSVISELQSKVDELNKKVEELEGENVKLKTLPGRISELEEKEETQRTRNSKKMRKIERTITQMTRGMEPSEYNKTEDPKYSSYTPRVDRKKSKEKSEEEYVDLYA